VGHAHEINDNKPPHLLGDRREQLVRRCCVRHQRGDPAQCGLLFGELNELADQDRDNSPSDREPDQRDRVGPQVNPRHLSGGNEGELSRQDSERHPSQRRPRPTDYRDRHDHQQRGKQEPTQHQRRLQLQCSEREQRRTRDGENPRCHVAGG
jgi:hypothetical protein